MSLTQKQRRSAIDREWATFSRNVLRSRPGCEAGVVFLEFGVEVDCLGRASQVHHKTPRNRGPIVPSQGLTPTAVLSVCAVCHEAIHGKLSGYARRLDLLR